MNKENKEKARSPPVPTGANKLPLALLPDCAGSAPKRKISVLGLASLALNKPPVEESGGLAAPKVKMLLELALWASPSAGLPAAASPRLSPKMLPGTMEEVELLASGFAAPLGPCRAANDCFHTSSFLKNNAPGLKGHPWPAGYNHGGYLVSSPDAASIFFATQPPLLQRRCP